MSVYRITKKGLFSVLRNLAKSGELIAPVKKDLVRFLPISNTDDIYLEEQSYFPAKEYFFPEKQSLFSFDGKGFTETIPKAKKRVFFGLRRCDLNAIKHQDTVFFQTDDPYYKAAREKSTLIGFHCNKAPSEYCFCGSLDLVDFHDLMVWDKGDEYWVETGSEKGEQIIQENKEAFTEHNHSFSKEEKVIPGADRLEDKDLSNLYDHPDWKEGVDKCLSCGACTSLCPTCYCFEIKDEVKSSDINEGERSRSWSSCQLQSFTKVAGDHVFRDSREGRFKHRIFHQLDYFKKRYDVNLCTGCGRCISGCPTRIDFVEIINGMKK